MQKKSSKPTKATSSATANPARQVTTEERRRMIAEAAYFRAQSRDFTGSDPSEDWLAAERDVDQALLAMSGGQRKAAGNANDNGNAIPFVGNGTAAKAAPKNRPSR
jgi:Protein of unknown function (DUF2934)